MLGLVKRNIRKLIRHLGYDLVPVEEFPPDFDRATIELLRYVRPFTLTSPERVVALRQSVEYVVRHNIPGDIVECGVWKGGSMMAVARTLMENNSTERTLYLFDTFEGMSEPTSADMSLQGESAAELLKQADEATVAYSPLDEVKHSLRDTGYDEQKVVFVKGKVEETLPERAPDKIALLRLDTDWYESTYHELTHLYPRLSVGGVLIIDDYGHWEGARKAVDQYISERNLKLLLNRIDYTGRICVKVSP